MSLQTPDLTRNRAESPDKAFEMYRLDRPGKIIFVGHHLSTSNYVRCLIRGISLYGAEIEVSPVVQLPKNFFLEILGIHDEIGCTLMRREEEKATIAFNMLIDPHFLHHVLQLGVDTH
jgi:hypothetical protein